MANTITAEVITTTVAMTATKNAGGNAVDGSSMQEGSIGVTSEGCVSMGEEVSVGAGLVSTKAD